MKTKFAVLNDKLFPVDVAELLLDEGLGSEFSSVQVTLNPDEDSFLSYLEDLLLQASQANIKHSFTISLIKEMLSKLLNNTMQNEEEISIKIIKGNKTFLHIYFIE